MKTLQQIKDEYAQEQGYEDWTHLLAYHILESSDGIDNHINLVIQIVQDELKKKVFENINIRIEILGQKDLAQITKECYFKESGAKVTIDNVSILNTENIK